MSAQNDVELTAAKTEPTKGFIAVSAKIAADPDKTTTIFRRFDELAARTLLLYEVELTELEEELRQCDEEDKRAKDQASVECQRDWREFVRGSKEDGREKRKMELVMTIRARLERYYDALIAHHTLLNASRPAETTAKAMRNWFFENSTGAKDDDKIPQLWGASESIYDNINDLVALRLPPDQDRLSELIQDNFGLFFRTSKSILNGRQALVSSQRLSIFTAILATILAPVLLFGAVISLYIVQNEHALLGMLSGWTVLFAASVGLLTNAKRDQIFAAAAAYAAVLVVFVSGNLGGAMTGTGKCACSLG